MTARPRLILADDHVGVVAALGQMLDRDYEVVATVADGGQLVEVATRIRPDVIVADLNMQTLSGLDALRQLKAGQVESAFVLMTSDSDPALAAETFRAGGAAYLLKHWAGEELGTAIEEALRGRLYLTPRICAMSVVAALSADHHRR